MVLKVMKFFRGYLFVRLTGYSPERFFNLCGNADIVLWKIEPAEDGYTFFVSLPAFRKLKPMLRKSGTRVTILKRVGVPFLLYRYRNHRFFFVGLGSLFAILFLMTQFIWAVEISGNSSYSGQVLRDFLAESGIGYGNAVLTVRRQRHCYAGNLMISPGCLPGYPVHGCMWISRSD